MRKHRRPRHLWLNALEWIKETGWQTRAEDHAIAEAVYQSWIRATNADWIAIHYRERENLMNALDDAFRPIRDDRAADALVVIYLWLLELRGRREGVLEQRRNN